MAAPVYPDNKGFLLAEDEAVKRLFSDITVPNDKGEPQKVRVWFRYPDAERQIIYPFITLDLVDIVPATELWHSEYPHQGDYENDPRVSEDRWYHPTDIDGTAVALYDPSTAPQSDSTVIRRNFLSYRLFYQAALWSKTAIHDRILSSRVMQFVLRPGPMWLYVPADDTYRRTEWLGWSPADIPTQDGNKRIFRKTVTFSVQAEIPQDWIEMLTERVQPVDRLLVQGFDMLPKVEGVDDPEFVFWTDSDPNVTNEDHWEEFAKRPPTGP